jgi:glycosyltransferase involved in cell wall biosynthesis
LKKTLESVQKLDLIAGLEHELILVETGITDDINAVLQAISIRGIRVRRIAESHKGLAKARNLGVKEASGQILLFTDDDVQLPQSWIEIICAPILAGTADAVAGEVVIVPHLQRPWMTAVHRSWLATTDSVDLSNPDRLVGANMAISRAVFEKVPAFDEELGAGALGPGEETLFSWQLKEAGFRLAGMASCRVWHHFQEDRLLRNRWLAVSKQFGISIAYLAHHWQHETILNARYHYYLTLAGYWIRRIVRWRQSLQKEGISEWELGFLVRLHQLDYYLNERKHPRKYGRKGLIKLHPPSFASENLENRDKTHKGMS